MHILKKILGLFFFTIFWICKVTKIVTWWSMAIGNCLLMNLHNSINRIIWGSFCLKLCLYYIPPAHTYSTHIICVWSCVCRYVCVQVHICAGTSGGQRTTLVLFLISFVLRFHICVFLCVWQSLTGLEIID